jgi:hypothetical protein
MESIYGWVVGLLTRIRIRLGFVIPLGMDTLPLRLMVVPAGIWLGMATRWRMDAVVFATAGHENADWIQAAAAAKRSRD